MSISKKIGLWELVHLIDELEQASDAGHGKMSHLMDETTQRLESELFGNQEFKPDPQLLEEIRNFPRLSQHRKDESPSGKAIEQIHRQRRGELEEFLGKYGITEESLPTHEELRLNEDEWLVLAKLHKHFWNDWSLFVVGCEELAELREISGYDDSYYHKETGTRLNKKKQTVSRDGFPDARLGDAEFDLVDYIARKPYSRTEELIDELWSESKSDNPERSFRTTLTNARRKIRPLKLQISGNQPGYALCAIDEPPEETVSHSKN